MIRPFVSVMALVGLATGAPNSPLSPAEAAREFELEPELEIHLLAAEPLVESPCAAAFDSSGRLFVAENRGYPSQADPPMGRIALLEDRNGDGQYESRTTFAEGLTFPNGVLPTADGLYVTCAPDLLLLRDTDGDGRADSRHVVLTGFATTGSTQLRVNDPTLRPDGWIYLAGGLSGGNVTNPAHPEFPAVDLAQGDLRYHPATGRFAWIDGKSQYGHEFDEAGNRFLVMNRIQVQHVVLERHLLRRNPNLAFSDTVQDCPAETFAFGLRGEKPAARIFPISDNITTADRHAGTFSAACGILHWSAGNLPSRYSRGMFSCDPTGNLVHWDHLEPLGATFSARREPNQTEFLRSRDNWFRPVFLAKASSHGGSVLVVDMYRKTIEHPDYLPVEMRKRTDFESGRTMGRLWLVTMSGAKRDAQLQIPTTSQSAQPAEDEISLALRNVNSPDPQIRFRAALKLGETERPEALPALGRILISGMTDRWTRAAVFSSSSGRAGKLLKAVLHQLNTKDAPEDCALLLEEAARLAVLEKAPEVVESAETARVKATIPGFSWRAGLLLGLGKLPTEAQTDLARQLAMDISAAPRKRLLAIRVLGASLADPNAPAALLEVLQGICQTEADPALQSAAIHALGIRNEPAALSPLMRAAQWPRLAPAAREVLLSFTCSRPALIPPLLDALESGAVAQSQILAAQRQQLLKNAQPALKPRVEKLFSNSGGGDRWPVYEAWKSAVLALAGKAESGRAVFQRQCATCHRLERTGVAVGPDLFDIRNQPKESILLHILVPNHEILPAFTTCLTETTDGRTLAGIKASETESSLTLTLPGGAQETLLRAQLKSVRTSAESLMPAALEQTMTQQEMADLLAHLRGE